MALGVFSLTSQGAPPAGDLSPLAWVIIVALVAVITIVIPALWYRGNKQYDRVYGDLKACNDGRAAQEEEILGVLKVLRLGMERSKGGKPR